MSGNKQYRSIPKVDTVLRESILQEMPYDPSIIKRMLQQRLESIRHEITQGRLDLSPDAASIAGEVAVQVRSILESGLKYIINAAGVVVFTNLGRAPLAQEALDAVLHAGSSYSDLEFNLKESKRGSRQDHIRP
jgi:L-seryl-tRNA(Ser) seleniumtransferase